jgi:hypothetical protein
VARREHDREDMLAEATALVERASLQLVGDVEPLVVGFRRDGSSSFYFSPERVYHFNAAGQLRRAYVDGVLYKAAGARLMSMVRKRTPEAVLLESHQLSDAEMTEFLTQLRAHLDRLQAALETNSFQALGQVPQAVNVTARVTAFLAEHRGPISIAESPRAG